MDDLPLTIFVVSPTLAAYAKADNALLAAMSRNKKIAVKVDSLLSKRPLSVNSIRWVNKKIKKHGQILPLDIEDQKAISAVSGPLPGMFLCSIPKDAEGIPIEDINQKPEALEECAHCPDCINTHSKYCCICDENINYEDK